MSGVAWRKCGVISSSSRSQALTACPFRRRRVHWDTFVENPGALRGLCGDGFQCFSPKPAILPPIGAGPRCCEGFRWIVLLPMRIASVTRSPKVWWRTESGSENKILKAESLVPSYQAVLYIQRCSILRGSERHTMPSSDCYLPAAENPQVSLASASSGPFGLR